MNENPRDKKKLSETDMGELIVRLVNNNPELVQVLSNVSNSVHQFFSSVVTAIGENKENIENFFEGLKNWSFLPNHVIVNSQERIDSGLLENYPDEIKMLKEYRQKAIESYGILNDKDASPDRLRTAAWEAIGAAYVIGLYLEPPDSFIAEIQNDLKNQAAANARQRRAQGDKPKLDALDDAIKQAATELNRALAKGSTFAAFIRPKVREILGIEPDSIETWPSAGTIASHINKMTPTKKKPKKANS